MTVPTQPLYSFRHWWRDARGPGHGRGATRLAGGHRRLRRVAGGLVASRRQSHGPRSLARSQLLRPLLGLFGPGAPGDEITGEAVSVFRKKGG